MVSGVINIFDKVLAQLNIIIIKREIKSAKDVVECIQSVKKEPEEKNIISTERVKQELEKRKVTREDFLQFYELGREKVKQNQTKLFGYIAILEEEIGQVFLDEKTGENLQEKIEDRNIGISKRITTLEQIRKNIVGVERLHDLLEKRGFLQEITTTSQGEKFERFLRQYDNSIKNTLKRFKIQSVEYQEDIDILNQEIATISSEMKTIELAKNEYKELESRAVKEKELRARQIKATMFGDESLEKEWDERVKRFYSNKIEVEGYTYKHKEEDGTEVIRKINYETIKDYKQQEQDAYFLNLGEYKKYLEAVSMYDSAEKKYGRGSGLEVIKKIVNLEDIEFEEYNRLTQKDEDKANEWLRHYVEDMREYVNTFHGFTNKYAVKSEVWRMSGSTLKNMKPVRGNIPTSEKIKNGTENVFRFLGIRKPEFYKIDSNENKVLTPGKGTLTLLTDAGIIAGITATAALTGTTGIATWGAAYVAKGVVTTVNVIRGKIEYNKHKDVIDANLPTLSNCSKDDKELIRKEYYREQKSLNKKLSLWDKFTTWAHAKSDRLFFRKDAANKIEQQILAEKIKLSDYAIEQRTQRIINNVRSNFVIADQNQRERQEISGRSNNTKIAMTKTMKNVTDKGSTVASSVITVEQKYKSRQQHQDRVNKLWTLLLTAGMKIGLDTIKTGFKEQVVTQKQVPVKKKEVIQEVKTTPGYKKWIEGPDVYKPVVGHKKIKELNVDKNIGDLEYSKECATSIYEGYQTFTKNRSSSEDIIGIVLKAKDKNGMTVEVSLAEKGMGLTTNHVHSLTNADLSKLSIQEAIEKLKTADPENYRRYVEAIGLKENASAEEIGKIALEQGQFFKQSSNLEGWTEVMPGNVNERVETFVEGMQKIHMPGHYEKMPDVTQIVNVEKTINTVETVNETKNVFSSTLLGNSTLQGSTTGFAVAGVEQLHESTQSINSLNNKDFEEKTTHFFTSRIVINEAKKRIKHREQIEKYKREAKERKKQAKREYRTR